jgi:5'-phosphate synthase pdxT subunit
VVALEALGVTVTAVRLPAQLDGCAGLIIPGGESTAIGKLMATYGFYEPVKDRHAAGMAIWGTCAGAILLARTVLDALPDQRTLGLMDITVRRNAYGRQSESFESDLEIAGVEGGPYAGVFIRAPWIEGVGEGVQVLARHSDRIVAARQGDLFATTFHPELTGDIRIHRLFVDRIVGSART